MRRITLATVIVLSMAAPPALAQEKSVRPGINKSFENPDVKAFTGRFEREGRDVFDHRRQVLEACNLKAGMSIADIGAGTGLFSRLFAARVGEKGKVFAVDIAEEFVEHIERSAEKLKLGNIRASVCQQDDVGLPPASIDLAFICDTYHHFEFPHKTMRSIHKALRPGGQVILIDFHRVKGVSREWVFDHVRAGQETFVQEITGSGFRQVEERKGLLKESYFVRFVKEDDTRNAASADAVPNNPPLRWWKGNIHTHTLWSDGNDFPEMIAEWYRTHDYNFLSLSDHNVLSEGVRFMKIADIERRGGKTALRKYQRRFGGGWVETRGEPGTPDYAVRLKPLNEFRALLEERGRFIMIQGEEISDRALGKPVHMNATNIKEVLPPVGGATVREAIANNFRAVDQQARRVGRPILLHLNHPNFGLAVTAEDLAAVTAERFFEVYNGHPGIKHLGDKDHPSVERLWDIANTLRLGKLKTPPMFGVSTDDSHNYHGAPGSHVGRGWVMVQARYLTPEHIIRAMRAGRFYSSSGVALNAVGMECENKIQLKIAAEDGVKYSTQFIGTLKQHNSDSTARKGADGKPIYGTRKYSTEIGRVLATVEGAAPSYSLTGKELYVRAVVTSSRPHPDPSFQGQFEQAWSQPFGWSVPIAKKSK